MRVKVRYEKGSKEVYVDIVAVSEEDKGEPTNLAHLFSWNDEFRGLEGNAQTTKQLFPLTAEGIADAQRFVEETVDKIREVVQEWRNISVPKDHEYFL